MIGLNSNVGSAQGALQQRPEVFDALRVDFTANVLFNVIDNFMDVLLRFKAVIAGPPVGVNGRPALDLVEDRILKSLALDVRHDLSANLAASRSGIPMTTVLPTM